MGTLIRPLCTVIWEQSSLGCDPLLLKPSLGMGVLSVASLG